MSNRPTKYVFPRPVINYDCGAGGIPAYHFEVINRNYNTALTKWEEARAAEEINFPKRLQEWETAVMRKRQRDVTSVKNVSNARILAEAQEIIRKEEERDAVNAMVRRLKQEKQLRINAMVRADIDAMTLKIQAKKQSDPTLI